MAGNFAHLHVHTEYSLLDGACRINELLQSAAEKGLAALAITDHGNMYGVIDFYKEAQKVGVKPIIGYEAYLAERTRHDREGKKDDSPSHLVLLAKNLEGYKNLLVLASKAFLEGFYYKPRIDWELLQEHHSGLIVLSSCLAGEIPRLLLQDRYEDAVSVTGRYVDLVGKGNFFLELQDHGMQEQQYVNAQLIRLAKETGVPLVVTNDVHYIEKEQASVHDVLLCIQTGKTLQDQDRMRFSTNEFYLKTRSQLEELFPTLPEALDNTLLIADQCNVELEFGKLYLPDYDVPPGYDVDSYLEELCLQGLHGRYREITQEIRERLNYELRVIRQMGYSGYFLIVWDMINFARKRGIHVGPGRGSAAGSLVAYVLGITDIDPLRYGLIFERFLNPERVSMPDIDTDFCFERRGEVIDYLASKYGQDHVAQIVTFGTMAAKAAIRDVGRAMNVPLSEVDQLAKLVPGELGITLERALEMSPDFRAAAYQDETHQRLVEIARALEGMPRHVSTHAAGVVISKDTMVNYLPLQKTNEDGVATQFPMQTVEEIGLLKMDLLGLRTLTVIGNTIELVRNSTGETIDMSVLPLDDPETYQLLSNGDTIGVFQLESSGMRSILRNLKPEYFEDIIALVALYRPGPLGSGMVEDFIARKHGKTRVSYAHPLLQPILESTYGVILYQEQVMRIASQLAGFTLGQADLLRRAMGKKKPEIIAAQRENFLQGALGKGIEEKVAGEIFDLMAYFAGYGFNKSHSAAYALLAYQTAFLKTHYPVAFMSALLSSVMGNTDKVTLYLEECRRLGIEVLPPDVNESQIDFTIMEGKTRFGLAAVKNVGISAIESILTARSKGPFTSLDNFCQRVDLRAVNKRVLESLIRCGAFSSLGWKRSQLLHMIESTLEQAQRVQEDRKKGQISFFDLAKGKDWEEVAVAASPPDLPEYPPLQLLAMEKETLGFYLSGHPVASYQWQFLSLNTVQIADLEGLSEGSPVRMGGIITDLKRTITKKGDSMAYLTLEDMSGSIRVLVFPKVFSQYSSLLSNDQIILLEGRLSLNDDEQKVFAEKITVLTEEGGQEKGLKVSIRENDAGYLKEIKDVVASSPGNTPLLLVFPKQGKCLVTDQAYWVELNAFLVTELEKICGKGSIRVMDCFNKNSFLSSH